MMCDAISSTALQGLPPRALEDKSNGTQGFVFGTVGVGSFFWSDSTFRASLVPSFDVLPGPARSAGLVTSRV